MNFRVHYKEKLYFWVMAAISACVYCLLLLPLLSGVYLWLRGSSPEHLLSIVKTFSATGGVIFLYALFFFVLNILVTLLFIGSIRGNGIRVTKHQFSDVHEMLTAHAAQLQLKKVPECYVLQGNGVLNAFAAKFLKQHYVILYSTVLEAAYEEGMDAVSFIVGHELGHIKRKHTNWLISLLLFPAKMVPFLNWAYSRAREYTCDNIGYHLAPKGALKGLLILAVGKKLHNKVNVKELLFTADIGFIGSYTEYFSTHPLLIKRIKVISELLGENAVQPDQWGAFVSPNVKIKPLPTSAGKTSVGKRSLGK